MSSHFTYLHSSFLLACSDLWTSINLLGRQRKITTSATLAKEEGLGVGGSYFCFVRTIKDFDSLKSEMRA